MPDTRTPRQRVLARLASLKKEREPLMPRYRELSEQIAPWSSRFLFGDKDRVKLNNKIINGTPPRAARTLQNGLFSGRCDPAQPWFRTVPDEPKTLDVGDVRSWCYDVEQMFGRIFSRSNFYNSMKEVFAQLVTFGTAAMLIEPHARDVIRCYVFPVGQYMLANSAELAVDTCYREFSMTTAQLVERFGLEKCSILVKTAWEQKQYEQQFEVLHAIEPNRGHEYGKDLEGKPWKSCFLETGAGDEAGFLAEEGFDEFPVMCPRWDVNGEDVYGTSPGMAALGDCKQLQYLERRYAQLLDKSANPPIAGPASLLNRKPTMEPNEFIPLDMASAGKTFGPAIVIDPNSLRETKEKILEVEDSINRTYLVHVFNTFSDLERDVTATEALELKGEKAGEVGPAIERNNDELMDPAFERVFAIAWRAGLVPVPPPEMQGQVIKIEYVSSLSQSGKLVAAASVERTVAFSMGLAAGGRLDALDLLDIDEATRIYADSLNAPPKILLSADKVKEIREQRAQQQQQQAQQEQLQAGAATAETLSKAGIGGQDSMTRVAQGMGAVA